MPETNNRTDAAREELANDSGKDLTCCWVCGAFHWQHSGPCPYCGAALHHQCWSTRDGKPAASHENYAKAYQRRAQHFRERAASCDGSAAAHIAALGVRVDAPTYGEAVIRALESGTADTETQQHAAAWLRTAGMLASDEAGRAATRAEVLADVDPVVLECWKLQGHKVGAMLADAQAAVIELQEKLEDATPGVALPAASYRLLGRGDKIERGDEVLADDTVNWLPLVGWEVGMEWGSHLMPVRRRTDGMKEGDRG